MAPATRVAARRRGCRRARMRTAALLAAEREQLLRPAWQVLGHEAELRAAGDFLTGDLAGERVLVVRAERGRLHALPQYLPAQPACAGERHAAAICRARSTARPTA